MAVPSNREGGTRIMAGYDSERETERDGQFHTTRRGVLAGAGVALIGSVAGCSGGSGAGGASGDSDGDGSGGDSGDGGGTNGEPDVVIVDSELRSRESYGDTITLAAFEVENRGNARVGEVSVRADWLDADGNKITDSVRKIETLGTGTTWDGRTEPKTPPDTPIESYELSLETEPMFETLDEVTVLDTSIETVEDYEEEQVDFVGEAEYTGSDEHDYVDAVVNLLDADGLVIDNGSESAANVDPDDSWRFEISFFATGPIHGEPDDVEVYFESQNL
jgi:hypothetical protein